MEDLGREGKKKQLNFIIWCDNWAASSCLKRINEKMVYLAKEQNSVCDFLQLKHQSLPPFLHFHIAVLHQVILPVDGYPSLP